MAMFIKLQTKERGKLLHSKSKYLFTCNFVKFNSYYAFSLHYRLLFHKEHLGFPLNAVRELKFLKCLQHKNVVQLKDVVTSKGCEMIEKNVKTDSNRSEERKTTAEKNQNSILSLCGNLYLVFEFVEHDLGGLLDSKYKFSTREVKCIAKQLFEVLEFLSEKKVLHRDIKSSNILITNRHQVKLADFGLARSIQSADGRELRADLTNNVVTMWYRAPELLLGAVRYSHSVDVWSVGCVLAELELGRPLFPGRTDVEQMDVICRILGTPNEELWSGVYKLPCYDSIWKNMTSYSSTLKTACNGRLSDGLIDLLERVLVFDPSRRVSAKIVLSNKYFLTQPLPPIDPTDLEPLNVTAGVSYHEYRTKQQKRQRGNESQADTTTSAAQVPPTTTETTAQPSAILPGVVPVPLPPTMPHLVPPPMHPSQLPPGLSGMSSAPIPPPFNAAGAGFPGYGVGGKAFLPPPPPPGGLPGYGAPILPPSGPTASMGGNPAATIGASMVMPTYGGFGTTAATAPMQYSTGVGAAPYQQQSGMNAGVGQYGSSGSGGDQSGGYGFYSSTDSHPQQQQFQYQQRHGSDKRGSASGASRFSNTTGSSGAGSSAGGSGGGYRKDYSTGQQHQQQHYNQQQYGSGGADFGEGVGAPSAGMYGPDASQGQGYNTNQQGYYQNNRGVPYQQQQQPQYPQQYQQQQQPWRGGSQQNSSNYRK